MLSFLLTFTLFVPNVVLGGLLNNLGDAKDAYDEGKDVYDKGKFAYDVYTYCKASGLSNCPTIAALCTAYQHFADPVVSKHMVSSVLSELAVNYYCLGEPPLKCCKRIGEKFCWSAFNQDSPINCEGNANYGPTETAGLCLAPCQDGCLGCVCNYLAECNSDLRRRRSLLESASSYNTNYWKLGRMMSVYWLLTTAMSSQPALNDDILINKYTSSYPDLYGLTWQSKQQQIIDFIEWRGCKYWLFNKQILIDNIPDYPLKDFRSDLITRMNDIFDDVIPIRFALPYYALLRYSVDIPQFWIKIDYILSNTWNNITRNEYLYNNSINSSENAEIELLKWIDYGGLLLLKDILNENWVLMSVNININDHDTYSNFTSTTTSVPGTGNDFYKCHSDNGRGDYVIINDFKLILIDDINNIININFNINDNKQQSNEVITKIYWGDNTDIDVYYSTNGITTNYEYTFDLSHQYSCNNGINNPQINIQIMNEAGLYSYYKQTLNMLCDNQVITELINGYPDIDTIQITLLLTGGGNQYGSTGKQIFYFEGATIQSFVNESNWEDGDFNTLGLSKWEPYGNDTAPINVTFSFKWSLASNIEFIRFTCRTYNNYLYSFINAKIVTLQLRLFSGILIDLKRDIDFIDSNDDDYIRCARRGDVYEDIQQWSVIKLNELNDVDIVFDNNNNNDNNDDDGYYYEIVPGQYMYNEITTTTTSTTSTTSMSPIVSTEITESKNDTQTPITDGCYNNLHSKFVFFCTFLVLWMQS